MALYWDKVEKALCIVENAKTNEDFQRWLEESHDVLDYDFDQYCQSCYEGIEMPKTYIDWALGVFINERGWEKDE